MERAVAYIRVSTSSQIEKYGIARQEEAIKKFFRQNEIELVETYTDAGISGAMKDDEDAPEKRTQLLAMLNALMEDETIEKVVVVKVDRLWRNSAAEEYICKRLRRLHVDIISIEEPDFSLYADDPSQKLMNRIYAAIAEFDCANIKKRLAQGRAAKAQGTGVKPAGSQPFGYKYSDDKRTTEIETREAPIVKEIYRRRLNGDTLQEIADWLNNRGFTSRSGGAFSKTTVGYILRNPYYCGILTFEGEYLAGQQTPLVSKEDWLTINPGVELGV